MCSLKSVIPYQVARRGSKFGVPAPVLVQIEEDIEKEIEFEKRAKESDKPPPEPVQQKVTCDFKSLDEMVNISLYLFFKQKCFEH